jgi:hypothetical protein
VVTTPSGLYRYFINDLVRVVGHLHRTPLLRFVQKGKGVTSITGEKLYESQALTGVLAVLGRYGLAAGFVMILADEEQRRYCLYVETDHAARPGTQAIAIEVDREFARLNVEYEAKRGSERLDLPSMHWLRQGAAESFKAHCVRQGQREGQFKTVALAYKKSLGFDLDSFIDAGSPR